MDYLHRENGTRSIYSSCNQMRAYVKCSPKQSKNYNLSTFPSSNRQNFEDSGKVLAVFVSEFYQSIAVQPTLVRWLSVMCTNEQLFL